MRTSTFKFKFILAALFCVCFWKANSQTDSLVKRQPIDTSKIKLNMDAIYNRPFLSAGKLPVAIGGYLEANTQFRSTDGVADGFSFQMRRMTLFVSSSITKKIKFLSELEFEDGTKEINLEYCAMDVELHPLLNLRGGIIMNPIGGFNQNHDGPRWDFIDRPISATGIIPSTLSNVGMGFHGKYFSHNWIVGYEAYLTNGFDDKVIDNEEGRTSLHAGKEGPEKFEESNSGTPMMTGKFALRNRKIGELGLSYMSGVYNKFMEDGLVIDNKRSATVMAVDFNTSQFKNKLNITGEFAKVIVDVPETFSQQYGTKQWGFYTDVVYTVAQEKMFGWPKAKINVGVRGEMVDYNVGKFKETGTNIGDDIWAIVPSIAFRPTGTTVIRLNYRIERSHDLFRNVPSNTGIIQFGFSSYF
jgi:hypothetical protein